MAAMDLLRQALDRLQPAARDYAEHVIREWIGNAASALLFVEALEMKSRAREVLGAEALTVSMVREATRLESLADRAIRALKIPSDLEFGGEDEFRERFKS